MEIRILASFTILVIFLVLFASATGMLILRSRKRDMRAWPLYFWAPVPGVVAVGIFAIAYFLSYASDYTTVFLFVVGITLSAWLVGSLFCAALVPVFRKLGVWGD